MAVYNKFQITVQDWANGVHNLASDQLTVALCAAANAPVAGNALLANLTEIAYTNLSSRLITTTSSLQTAGTYRLILQDLLLTASGGSVATFRYVVIYNSGTAVKTNPLIGFYDNGSDVTLADTQQYLIDFNQTNGLFALA